MNRNYKLFLKDINDSILYIENYLRGISKEVFKEDVGIQDKVIRRAEIIGEATKNLPKSLKEKNPSIPWKTMKDLREVIVHYYYEMSLDSVWIFCKEELPLIKEKLKKIKLV